jgi:hypothetical protein
MTCDPRLAGTISELQREMIVEYLRIVAIKASHAADDIMIADDECAGRSIEIAISNLREAAKAWRQLQALEAATDAVESRQDEAKRAAS